MGLAWGGMGSHGVGMGRMGHGAAWGYTYRTPETGASRNPLGHRNFLSGLTSSGECDDGLGLARFLDVCPLVGICAYAKWPFMALRHLHDACDSLAAAKAEIGLRDEGGASSA
jgi:hypothetical protein